VEDRHAAARQLQSEHFDFEIDTLRFQATTDWDGNVRTVRTYDGCRPNAAGRSVWEINFRERVVGLQPDPRRPTPSSPSARSHPAWSTS